MRFASLSVVLLVVLAGCGGGTTPSTTPDVTTGGTPPSTATTPAVDTIAVRGDALPVDADRAFARVETMLGADLQPPIVTVRVRDPSSFPRPPGEPRYFRLLGIRYPNQTQQPVYGATRNGWTVFLGVSPDASAGAIRSTLVHEYAHVHQYQTGVFGPDTRLPAGRVWSDGWLTRRAVVEGAATYVEDAYGDNYRQADASVSPWAGEYASFPAWKQYKWAPYHFGSRYVAASADSPRGLRAVYENPPRTTEQVIHPGNRDAPVPLNVSANASGWRVANRQRMGELVTRVVLASELASERAAAAAAGWGNDELVSFDRAGEKRSYAWVWRWDDAANATAFERALTDALDSLANATATGGGWQSGDVYYRVERPDDRTVVLYLGAQTFVTSANVSSRRSASPGKPTSRRPPQKHT